MKKIFCTMATGALIAWAGTAAANSLFYELQEGHEFNSTNNTKTWTFNLDNDTLHSAWDGSGYAPYGPLVNINPEDKVIKAWIEISFYDDDFVVNPNTGNERPAYKEFAALTVDGTSFFESREIDDGYYHRNITAGFLNDHLLTVSIDCLSGDFEVQGVLLGGSFRDRQPYNNPVPEPATFLLFGTGLAGLAFAGRRKSRS